MPALTRTGVASLTALAAALVFGVVLGFVLAFGSTETDTLEERWARLGVEEVEFVFLGNLQESEQEAFREELRSAQVVFAERFGAVTSDFTVYASTELEELSERFAEYAGEGAAIRIDCGGIAGQGTIFLSLGGCTEEPGAMPTREGLLAHEYFHILQEAMTTVPGDVQPIWFTEGSAVYAAALDNEAVGNLSLTEQREGTLILWSGLGSPLPDFRNLRESLEHPFRYLYQVGFLAADWLATRAGSDAILEFFRLGGHLEAFEQAFGMTLQEFLVAFEEYRLAEAPPFEARVAGRIIGSDGLPIETIALTMLVRLDGEAWQVEFGSTDEDGAFDMDAPDRSYTLGLTQSCAVDGLLIRRYLGEWGAEGFVAYETGQAAPVSGGDRTDLVIELPETRESLATRCREG